MSVMMAWMMVERQNVRGQIFPADLCYYTLIWFDLERPQLARWHMWGSCIFILDQPCPIPRGGAPASPKFWGPLMYTQTLWPRATKSGMVKLLGRSVFLGVTHAHILRGWGPSIPKISGTSYMCARSTRNSN